MGTPSMFGSWTITELETGASYAARAPHPDPSWRSPPGGVPGTARPDAGGIGRAPRNTRPARQRDRPGQAGSDSRDRVALRSSLRDHARVLVLAAVELRSRHESTRPDRGEAEGQLR